MNAIIAKDSPDHGCPHRFFLYRNTKTSIFSILLIGSFYLISGEYPVQNHGAIIFMFMLSDQRHHTQETNRTPSMGGGVIDGSSTPASTGWPLWLYRFARLGISAVFIWSGLSKLWGLSSFAVIIESYGLIPEITVLPTALLLAAIELVAGLGLLFDLEYTLGLIAGLLVLFMLILAYGLWMGLDVDCGCFGPKDPEAEAYHGLRPALYRDMVMLAGIGYLYGYRRRHCAGPLAFSTIYQRIITRK
jgi:uncharacterized membrane protein YphA (DoxX/SURF4 family)